MGGIFNPVTAQSIGAVPIDREVIAGTNMTGGGALSSDITLDASGGGGAAWALLSDDVISGLPTSYDVTDLAGYNDIIMVLKDFSLTTAGAAFIRVSTNNGVSFFAGASDYQVLIASGADSFSSGIPLTNVTTTTTRTSALSMNNLSLADSFKICHRFNRQSDGPVMFVGSEAAITAIQIVGTNGGTLSAGRVLTYVR